jgi:hypothetical protein
MTTPVHADEIEVRDFSVSVKNKPAGHYRMTIVDHGNGQVTMSGEASVRVNYLVYKYSYGYRGSETWQNGRLARLESASNDNGKSFQVRATPAQNGLNVEVNGRSHLSRPDAWTTTYWHSPDARFHNQAVPLLDADTGKDISAHLQVLADQQVNVNGQQLACSHYRLTGNGLDVELCYDQNGRLTRQKSIEEGQPTVLELRNVQRISQ